MRITTLLAVSTLLFLTACSSGPSTSDAKDVVLKRIGGGEGCSRLAIEDFEKVNGIAEDETHYQVAVKYTVMIKAPRGNEMTQERYDSQAKPEGTPGQADLEAVPSDTLWRDCPQISSDLRGVVYKGNQEFEQQNPGKIGYLNGYSIDMTETIPMIKTDNGWQGGL